MARKNKRKVKLNLGKNVLKFLKFAAIKVLPFVFVFGVIGTLAYFAIEALRVDAHLRIQSIRVLPSIGLSVNKRQSLEKAFIGKHILRVPLRDVEQQIIADPEVKSAEVVRVFPSTLEIRIQRRIPIGLIHGNSKGSFAVISTDGVILQLTKEAVKGMTLFEAPFLTARDLVVGQRITAQGFERSARFLMLYQDTEWSKSYPVNQIAFDVLGNVSIYFPNSPEIRLGRQPEDRIPSLTKVFHLLADPESSKISYMDIQFDNVIVRKKGA